MGEGLSLLSFPMRKESFVPPSSETTYVGERKESVRLQRLLLLLPAHLGDVGVSGLAQGGNGVDATDALRQESCRNFRTT